MDYKELDNRLLKVNFMLVTLVDALDYSENTALRDIAKTANNELQKLRGEVSKAEEN